MFDYRRVRGELRSYEEFRNHMIDIISQPGKKCSIPISIAFLGVGMCNVSVSFPPAPGNSGSQCGSEGYRTVVSTVGARALA